MPGVPRPALAGIDFKDPLIYYAFVSLLFLLALFLMKNNRSPLGKILQAIRETKCAPKPWATTCRASAASLRRRRRLLGPCGRALRDAVRDRAAGGDQLRVFR
jgi:hypothetical protein